MPFKTANSSFILERLRLSIKLCAVFRAIFRPAALVAEGCFLLFVAVVARAGDEAIAAALPLAEPLEPVACSSCGSSCARGFICMIFLDLVGGGGRAKDSVLACPWAAEERLRDLTDSATCRGKGALDDSGDGGAIRLSAVAGRDASLEVMAGGGSSNDICRLARCFVPSCPGRSVDEAGVGGSVARGILLDTAQSLEAELLLPWRNTRWHF